MKQLIGLSFILLFSLPSLALNVSLFPFALEQRYTENENQDLYMQKMDSSLAAAFSFDGYQLGLETTKWSHESSAPLISYKETYTELNSTHLFLMGSTLEYLHLYSGIGVGMYESKLKNSFNGIANETNSGQTLFASGIASAQFVYSYFHAALDFRLLMGKDYRPQPTPSGVFKIGITF